MTFPVSNPYQITTYFNSVTHPGIDIAPLPAGTQGVQCHAPESCTVVQRGFVATLEGNYLILRGKSGMFYYFGHFATVLVTQGQSMDEGATIGILGMTGDATGIHTHHEVRRQQNGGQVDPVEYYKKEDNMNYMQATVDDEEGNRTLFLATLHRDTYPQEKGRYIGWKWNDAYINIVQNQDRGPIDQMAKAYYDNGSKIPDTIITKVLNNNEEYKPA